MSAPVLAQTDEAPSRFSGERIGGDPDFKPFSGLHLPESDTPVRYAAPHKFPETTSTLPPSRRILLEKQPAGLRLGTLTVLPRLDIETRYDSNIYAASDAKDDFIAVLRPRLTASGDFGRHEATFEGGFEHQRFATAHDNDNTQGDVTLKAKLEARHDIVIPVTLSYADTVRERGTSVVADITEKPLRRTLFRGTSGVAYKPGRLGLTFLTHVIADRQEDGTDRNTGQPVIRRDNDRDTTQGQFILGYDLKPNFTLELSALAGQNDFKRRRHDGAGFNGPLRDSDDYSVRAGVRLAYKGLLTGAFHAGADYRNYDDPALKAVRAFAMDADLTWAATQRSTLDLSLRRLIDQDDDTLTGIVTTGADAGVEYALTRDIALGAGALYTLREVEENGRDDITTGFRLGLTYAPSRFWTLGGDARALWRDSDDSALDYDRQIIMLRLTGAL